MVEELYKRHRSLIIFSTIITTAFLLIYAAFFRIELPGLSNWIRNAFTPLQQVVHSSIQRIYEEINTEEQIDYLQKEVKNLKEKILRHKASESELDILRKENIKLKKLLGYQAATEYANTAAKIIAKDPQNFFSTLIINKGKKHDIEIGLPVIGFTENGFAALVGKVHQVSERSAKVITILDQRCHVGVMIKETGDTGIMKGIIPTSPICALQFIDRNATILELFDVHTSGLGGKYPSEIPIGTITKVQKENFGLFQICEITPFINFFKLTEVFVFLKTSVQTEVN